MNESPKDIDWVLRVDGHTDRVPVNWSSQFASNWELSQARALAVVLQLIDLGIPPQRLMAAGFGEHQPIEAGDDEIAYRRNRRIEFKLTERRSDERRVGKEWCSTCRTGWTQDHKKKKQRQKQ